VRKVSWESPDLGVNKVCQDPMAWMVRRVTEVEMEPQAILVRLDRRVTVVMMVSRVTKDPEVCLEVTVSRASVSQGLAVLKVTQDSTVLMDSLDYLDPLVHQGPSEAQVCRVDPELMDEMVQSAPRVMLDCLVYLDWRERRV